MIEIKKNLARLAPLFVDYHWNYLVEAVLDGTMGKAWADDAEAPRVAVVGFPRIQLFIAAGDAALEESRAFLANLSRPSALVFASPGWEGVLKEMYGKKIVALPRYAFTSEALKVDHLQALAAQLPQGYRLAPLNLRLARQLAEEQSRFSEDHFVNFASLEQFLRLGFGFCVLEGEQIVSAATTFLVCRRGIEIQINTREEHQHKGLATAVAARLLLYSLEQGLDPGWDAANEVSAELATKLGYTFQGKYTIFVVTEGD
jgi:hypothetical protein